MALYEYQCESCGHRFELIQRFSDPPPEACPKCGGPVRKLVSSPAFQFKGSGWYATDYAKKSGSPKSESGSNGGSSESADGGRSESSDKSDKS